MGFPAGSSCCPRPPGRPHPRPLLWPGSASTSLSAPAMASLLPTASYMSPGLRGVPPPFRLSGPSLHSSCPSALPALGPFLLASVCPPPSFLCPPSSPSPLRIQGAGVSLALGGPRGAVGTLPLARAIVGPAPAAFPPPALFPPRGVTGRQDLSATVWAGNVALAHNCRLRPGASARSLLSPRCVQSWRLWVLETPKSPPAPFTCALI